MARPGFAMLPLSPLDLIAFFLFAGAWAGYAVLIEFTAHGKRGLNAQMDGFREQWIRRMLDRDMRMTDMQIMAALQNGTAFFASTSLLAIGGALTLLRVPEELLALMSALPFNVPAERGLWEIKTIGLVLILVYAFFKFAWSYRLFNYVAILYGAMPPASEKDRPETEAHVIRATRLFQSAGKHFNRGQRAFFLALGYLGWFVSPIVLIITTAATVVIMWRRQFASDASRAMRVGRGS
jgi:uncharacterized membrane protein